MSYFIYINATQTPFDIGTDTNSRVMVSCNYLCKIRGTSAIVDMEVAQKISDAGYGTYNTDMFVGLRRKLPTGDGPYVQVIKTSGLPPLITRGDDVYITQGIQIIATGSDYNDTHTRAKDVFDTLYGVTNTTITSSL